MSQNKHIIFYLTMCILLTYFRVLAKLVIPIKGEEYFNWKQTDIAKLWVLSMIAGAIPTMVVISIPAKYVNDFFLYLSSLITLLLCLLLMGLLPMFTNKLSLSNYVCNSYNNLCFNAFTAKGLSETRFFMHFRKT